MDVIFWNDCPYPNVGLLHRYAGPYKLAHWIGKFGYESQVIDFTTNFSEDELFEITSRFITEKTMAIGISLTFIAQHLYEWKDGIGRRIPEHMYKAMDRIKKAHPKIKLVLGGYLSEMTGGWGVVDCSVAGNAGNAEDIFLELLDHWRKGTPEPQYEMRVPQWAKRMLKIYVRANENKYNIETDDSKFTLRDCILPKETLPLELSRGCIFKCRFCQYPNLGKHKLDYLRHPECIKNELIYNYENFGTTSYYMLCDTFNDTEYKMEQWHKMVTSLPFKIKYSAYLRADLIHRYPSMAHYLKDSGLVGAYHGIESLHPTASKLIGKGWSGKHARDWIPKLYHDIWQGQVPMHTNFIVGLPGEKREHLLDTVKWYKDNDLHCIHFDALAMFNPPIRIPSEFERNADKYGFKFDEQGRWYNDDWTKDEAYAYADELNEMIDNDIKIHIWDGLSLIGMGYPVGYISRVKNRKFNWDDVNKRKQILLNQYKNKLRSL